LQRRSQIRHSQLASAAESVLSSVRFLIRSRVPLLVLKASKIPSLALGPMFHSPFDFSFSCALAARLAGVARTRTKSPLVEYRLSIFIAMRSACVAYISDISRSNGTMYDFQSQLDIVECTSPTDRKMIFTY